MVWGLFCSIRGEQWDQKSLLKGFYSEETPTEGIFRLLILLYDAVISSSSVGLGGYSEFTLRQLRKAHDVESASSHVRKFNFTASTKV